MSIHEVIRAIHGDTNAQAIELRMDSGSQTFVNGQNLQFINGNLSVTNTLLTFGSNVSNGSSGSRIFVATAGFTNLYPGFAADFIMTPGIISGDGRIIFAGTVNDVAFGSYAGAHFHGSTAAFLPTNSIQSLELKPGISFFNQSNDATDYQLIGMVTLQNNAGATLSIPEPGVGVCLSLGIGFLAVALQARKRRGSPL